MDKVGLDVVLDIEEHYAAIHPELPSGPRELLKQYIQEGRLGRKTRKGFYTDYEQKASGSTASVATRTSPPMQS
jgi:3-hydroxybutyryl-CoA dehydrogenase